MKLLQFYYSRSHRPDLYLDTLVANGTPTTYEAFSSIFGAFRSLGNAYWPQIGPKKSAYFCTVAINGFLHGRDC